MKLGILLVGLGLLTACKDKETPLPTAESSKPAGPGKVEIVAAPADGDVAPIVATQLVKARAAGKQLVVYVGATWCEPCQHFHEAAVKGILDQTFPTLRLLEFDLDKDRDRLAAAGYTSKLIPLFVAPNNDGTASMARVQGSIKGEGDVADIIPRLQLVIVKAPR